MIYFCHSKRLGCRSIIFLNLFSFVRLGFPLKCFSIYFILFCEARLSSEKSFKLFDFVRLSYRLWKFSFYFVFVRLDCRSRIFSIYFIMWHLSAVHDISKPFFLFYKARLLFENIFQLVGLCWRTKKMSKLFYSVRLYHRLRIFFYEFHFICLGCFPIIFSIILFCGTWLLFRNIFYSFHFWRIGCYSKIFSII